MSALETYLKACRDSIAWYRVAAIRNLRLYVRTTPEQDLIEAIRNINDPTLLRYLWAAGLSDKLQRIAIERQETLAGVG